jgi:hypothetical protein
MAGLQYVAFGILMMAIAWAAFRHGRRWAWWAMWTFPLAGVAQAVIIVASTAPGQAIDGAALTGSVVAIIGAAVLLWSAPAFRPGAASEGRNGGVPTRWIVTILPIAARANTPGPSSGCTTPSSSASS